MWYESGEREAFKGNLEFLTASLGK